MTNDDKVNSTKTLCQRRIERVEVKMSIFLAQHNVPLSVADHLSPMIMNVFDGDVAKEPCILNGAVSPMMKNELISSMQSKPFLYALMDPVTQT